jgi:tetratricopeptide (TPR) repeat protein
MSACAFSDENEKTELVPLPNEENFALDKMIDFWDEVIKKDPENDKYYFKRALLYLKAERLSQALLDLEKASAYNPQNAEYYYYQAVIFSKQNSPEKAIVAAERAFALDFRRLEIYKILGKTEFERENYEKALTHFEQIMQLAPQDPEPYFLKGKTLLSQKDTLGGLEWLKKSVDIASDYAPAYLSITDVFLAYKGYSPAKTAQEVMWKALKNCRENPDLFFQYGNILERLYKRDSALICYENAVKTDPAHWKSINKIGIFHFQDQKYELAETLFLKTLTIQPNLMSSNYFLGFIYENHKRDIEKAEKYYRRASELAPENKVIAETYRRVSKRLEYERYKLSPEYQLDLKRMRERKLKELDSVNRLENKTDSAQ